MIRRHLEILQRTGEPPTQYQFKEFKPETVASWELGYKGIIANKLFIDVYGFYAQYTNFIGLTVLVKNPLIRRCRIRRTLLAFIRTAAIK